MKKSEMILNELGQTDEKYLNTKAPRKKGFVVIIAAAAVLAVLSIALPVISRTVSSAPRIPAVTNEAGFAFETDKTAKATEEPEVTGENTGTVRPEPKKLIVRAANDKLSDRGVLGEGKFKGEGENVDRDILRCFRFVKSGGKVYACLGEDLPYYEFDGNGFKKTDHIMRLDSAYLNGIADKYKKEVINDDTVYDGYAYVNGFYAFGPLDGTIVEKGLLRVNVITREIEKYIDCDAAIGSVVLCGSKLYYNSYAYNPITNIFHNELKRVDLQTGEILLLAENKSNGPYYSIRLFEGDVYVKCGEDMIMRMTDDLCAYEIRSDVSDFTVSDGKIYGSGSKIIRSENGEIEKIVIKIRVYDLYGAELDAAEFTVYNGVKTDVKNDSCYIGNIGYFGDPVIFNGKLVVYDEYGLYLYDFENKTYGLVTKHLTGGEMYRTVPHPHFTVYGGALYVEYGYTVFRYSNGEIKTFEGYTVFRYSNGEIKTFELEK